MYADHLEEPHDEDHTMERSSPTYDPAEAEVRDLAEAAFDWPIYRAALGTDPYRCTVPGCDGLLATDRLCDGHADTRALTGHDCAYCGAILTPGVEQVCNEQGGDPAGTWMCSEGNER